MVERSECFNKTTNSKFTDNFIVFKMSVNIYFVGIAILIGLVGNALSVIVLRHDRLADAKQRSATNHLLRMLAIVDSLYLITCIFIQTLKTIIENTEWFPDSLVRHHYLQIEPLVWVLSSAAQTSTVWLVLLVTLDRYLAVCKPWKSRISGYMSSLVVIMGIAALVYNVPRYFERVVVTRRLCKGYEDRFVRSFNNSTSSLLTGPSYIRSRNHDIFFNFSASLEFMPYQNFNHSAIVNTGFHPLKDPSNKYYQHHLGGDSLPMVTDDTIMDESIDYVTRTIRTDFRFNKLYFLLYKTVMYFVFRSVGPLILLLYFNWRLIYDLRKVRKRRRDMLSRRVQDKENITIMLVVVVTVFIICQIPALAVRVAVTIMEFNHDINLDIQILRYINELSNALLTFNSSVNFVIYCLVGKKFQKSFMSLISCRPDIGVKDDVTQSQFKAVRREEFNINRSSDPYIYERKRDASKMEVQSFLTDEKTGVVTVVVASKKDGDDNDGLKESLEFDIV